MTDAASQTSRPRVTSERAPAAPFTVRLLERGDSIRELTRLLHRAYRPQVEMGLRPLAGRQTEKVTRGRTSTGENYLAIATEPFTGANSTRFDKGRILGTILFEEIETADFPPHFLRDEVAHFSLFGVDPDCQSIGIGAALLKRVEERAKENGARELALSMAEPDRNLYDYYLRRGFRFVEHWQWPYTNYRSAILSKAL